MNIERLKILTDAIITLDKSQARYQGMVDNPSGFLSLAGVTQARKALAHAKGTMKAMKAELINLLEKT